MSKVFSGKVLVISFLLFCVFTFCDYLVLAFDHPIINGRAFFGTFGNNVNSALLSIVGLFVLWALAKNHKRAFWPLILISIATISNVFDRFFYGGVVDYIKITFIPIFNLADVLIIISLAILIYIFLSEERIEH